LAITTVFVKDAIPRVRLFKVTDGITPVGLKFVPVIVIWVAVALTVVL
jgi:hypothetical protein